MKEAVLIIVGLIAFILTLGWGANANERSTLKIWHKTGKVVVADTVFEGCRAREVK